MNREFTGVFEGGGIRGLALAGAAAGSIDLGIRYSATVGTSAGAIVSALVAAGTTSDELRRVVVETDWPAMLPKTSTLRKNVSMATTLGFHSAAPLEDAIRSALGSKGVVTFADLAPGSLRVVATDLNHGKGVVLPDDLEHFGYQPESFPVARAVLMSSAVPFVFRPVRLRDANTGELLLMADGALAARFPRQLVPGGPNTIGFRLRVPAGEHTHHRIRGPVSLATAVISAGITAREDLPPICGPLDKLVEVVVDHESLDFDVTPRQAEALFDIGYQAVVSQLDPTSALLHAAESD